MDAQSTLMYPDAQCQSILKLMSHQLSLSAIPHPQSTLMYPDAQCQSILKLLSHQLSLSVISTPLT